ncbi:MAG: ATPase domain-containing protein [Thermoplasmata archaeon]|nr:hypothetical protein [Staphylococcus epidermidis]
MVKCNQCGGEIDENTLQCKKCGKKYSKEEYNSLLLEFIIESLKGENEPKNYENIFEEINGLEKWLKGEEERIKEIELETGNLENAKIVELKEELLEKKKEIEEKSEEIKKSYEDLKILKENIKLVTKNILDRLNFIYDIKNKENLILLLVEYSEKINELENQIFELKIENEKFKEILNQAKYFLDAKDYDELNKKIENLLMENAELRAEIESLQNRVEIQKELWEDWVSSQPENIKDLSQREMKVKEQEILLEKQLKELGEKEKLFQLKQVPIDAENIKKLEIEKEILKSEVDRLNSLIKVISSGNTDILNKTEEILNVEKIKMENQNLKSQVEILEKEIKDLKEKLKFKEEEFSRREQDLLFREKKVEQMMRELESQKIEIEELKKLEKEHKIEDLNELIKRKEEQLREKEKYLREKEKELDARTKGIIEKEIAMAQEEIVSEIKEQKVKTGTRRLDDLLYGGFPLGSNIIVYGPAYTGKEVLIYSFLAEGLKKGIPALVILTDKTIEIFEEDVKYVLPTWDTYVENGLVKYLDAYSKTIGEKSDRKNVIYIDSQTDINGIVEGIDKIVSELKSNYKYYRLAFFSLSTILTFLDAPTVVRFLQPFTTKRKKERAVSLYLLEKGLHEENAIQLVSHLMDGTIEFKLEMGKVYLQVNGITEAQSRSWIEISPSKSGIIMGSFTLGHIR